LAGTAHCIDSTNVDLPSLAADPARVAQVLTSAGATGAPPTDSERTASYDGSRGSTVPVSAPAQWLRYCNHAARDDSVARANAPLPLGVPRTAVALDTVRLAACVAGATGAFTPLTSGP
jgi:hypothetical protein